jgi:hypothetical protein
MVNPSQLAWSFPTTQRITSQNSRCCAPSPCCRPPLRYATYFSTVFAVSFLTLIFIPNTSSALQRKCHRELQFDWCRQVCSELPTTFFCMNVRYTTCSPPLNSRHSRCRSVKMVVNDVSPLISTSTLSFFSFKTARMTTRARIDERRSLRLGASGATALHSSNAHSHSNSNRKNNKAQLHKPQSQPLLPPPLPSPTSTATITTTCIRPPLPPPTRTATITSTCKTSTTAAHKHVRPRSQPITAGHGLLEPNLGSPTHQHVCVEPVWVERASHPPVRVAERCVCGW